MSRIKISYNTKIFILVAIILAVCEGAFIAFQYVREQQYRRDQLNAQLMVLNYQLLDHFDGGVVNVEEWERTVDLPIKMLRMSIFDLDGNILYDNKGLDSISNALELPELKMAAEPGSNKGYSVHESAFSPDEFYYYAALKEGDVIARTGALEYSVGVSEFLKIDRTFIWYAILIYAIILFISYIITLRNGLTLKRLSNFAKKAESGEEIYDAEVFPNNELGNIAHNIVLLYMKLQRTVADRDRKAALAVKEEQEKTRIKRELTNNINHELKTPVSAISLELETLITRKDQITEAQRDMLINRCKANSDRLLNMIQDILLLNRLEDGASVIQRELLSLRDVVDEVMESVQAKADAAGIEIEIDLPESMMMLGNASLLGSIFRNLITNSINYSGASKFYIKLQVEDEAGFRLIIGDNGSGIPSEHLEHLFDRFYRIENGRSRSKGGTGMGLAIVKNSAKFHHGDITVRNVPSGGLEFTLTLSKN
ncbi:MAG: HAMP domain-containing histidine kinase [Muribaculaceae bacterium]|nr:HAMP domain-containing histidine kinase [Muribaculaceae bacterium]